MSDATLHSTTQDPDDFAVQIADQVESFLVAVVEVAKGDEPDSAVPFLLLQLSQLLLAGGRLGAHADFLPEERYEPDLGPEPDVDELRERYAALLAPVDVYSEVFDPYEPRTAPVPARISDGLADIVADLRHGMAHYRAGRTAEALWWWQFSYFSNWGTTASAALRALQSLVVHVRLNQPLPALDGLDTDQDLADESLDEEAGRVMAEEIGAPWACARSADLARQTQGQHGGPVTRLAAVVGSVAPGVRTRRPPRTPEEPPCPHPPDSPGPPEPTARSSSRTGAVRPPPCAGSGPPGSPRRWRRATRRRSWRGGPARTSSGTSGRRGSTPATGGAGEGRGGSGRDGPVRL